MKSMKFRSMAIFLLGTALILSVVPNSVASVKIGDTCKKLGQMSQIGIYKLSCTSKGKKLVWAKYVPSPKLTAPMDILPLPESLVPTWNFSTSFDKITITVDPTSGDLAKQFGLDSVYLEVYIENQPISLSQNTIKIEADKTLTWNISGIRSMMGGVKHIFNVRAGYINSKNEKNISEIKNYEVGFTPSPAQSAPASASPVPSPSASAISDSCQPPILPNLPLASERMAITKLEWKKDSSGYVSAVVTIRNDNSMSLRVVQYQFFYWYDLKRFTTAFQYNNGNGTTTVEHVFSKDTEGNMGIENLAGSWLPGQSRSFLIDTRKILDCSRISMLDSDYNVTQGVGG